ncbi:CheR family methyltransferase [Treponema sp.]|uniref:CheR family methyltransferase n=1 Tax=Treponema sp. TaxID=166 RepID=UPI003F020152
MTADEKTLRTILSRITGCSGIIPSGSHLDGIKAYIEKRCRALGFSSAEDFLALLEKDGGEFTALVNEATINETYFFREEKQFDLLRGFFTQKFFCRRPVRIWSAACSSGEEAWSLALLARSCGTECIVHGSDLNTQKIKEAENGAYSKKSLRGIDGKKFHFMLEPFMRSDGTIHLDKAAFPNVSFSAVNLLSLADGAQTVNVSEKQDIIFARNVFIYFSREVRARIIATLAERLSDEGILFLSIGEIASFDAAVTPPCLEKCSFGDIYFFRKKKDLL